MVPSRARTGPGKREPLSPGTLGRERARRVNPNPGLMGSSWSEGRDSAGLAARVRAPTDETAACSALLPRALQWDRPGRRSVWGALAAGAPFPRSYLPAKPST